MTKTFAERCKMFEQCLPDASYRDLLKELHTEMLAKLTEQPAPVQQEPGAWRVKVETKLRDGSVDVGYQTRNEKLSKHDEPLYTTPQAQRKPLTLQELEAAWNAQADHMNQWNTLGLDEMVAWAQAAHNIKENT